MSEEKKRQRSKWGSGGYLKKKEIKIEKKTEETDKKSKTKFGNIRKWGYCLLKRDENGKEETS